MVTVWPRLKLALGWLVLLGGSLALAGSMVQAPPPVLAVASAPRDKLEIVLFEHPKPAPALRLTALDGSTVDLSAQRGKVVLLNFWATWCGPCKEEIPALVRIQKEYAGTVQVIGLATDNPGDTTPKQVAAKAAALGVNYPIAMANLDLQRAFGGVPVIPATFVIDPDGQIEQRNRGAQSYAMFEAESRVLLKLPVDAEVHRIDQLSPNGKVGIVDIPGIAAEMKALTPAQRTAALARLNEQSCDCGCDQSLASCRVEDPNCGYSLPESKKVIAALAAAGGTPGGSQ